MGTVGDELDNAVAESFFATLQTELLDRHVWTSRRQLARGIFDYIETFYNPVRRHSYCGYPSPADYDHKARHIPPTMRHDHPTEPVRKSGATLELVNEL